MENKAQKAIAVSVVKISSRNQITIPKFIMKKCEWKPGDELHVFISPEKVMILKKFKLFDSD